MIAIPLLIAVVIALNYFSSKTSSDHIEELASKLQNVAIVDQSSIINTAVTEQAGVTLHSPEATEALIEKVRTNEIPALIVFPENLTTSRNYKIYIDGNDITTLSATTSLADTILKTSLFLPLGSAEVIALAQNGASSNVTFFEDGRETSGFNEYIIPGMFVVLFYIIFAFSISYMLTSVSEEKENRSMEMVLTYVKPRTLIVGKLLGVSLVTLTQITFFAFLALIGYLVAQQLGSFSLPFGIDLAKITFDPIATILGFGYLIAGFLMFAGFMTTVAAIAPSSKEANNFSSVFFIGAFIPFYFITVILTDPKHAVVGFLTFFPLTSPVVTLIRNTVGNMDPVVAWSALALMIVFMFASIWVAVRAFRLGALEFAQTLKLSTLFKKS